MWWHLTLTYIFKVIRPWIENRVRSVTFSVLDRLFPYLPQIITSIRVCVACLVYNKILKFQLFATFSNFSAFILKKNLQFCLYSLHIWHKSSSASEGVSQCKDLWPWPIFSFWLGIRYDSMLWVIIRRWVYPQNAGVLVVLVKSGVQISIY